MQMSKETKLMNVTHRHSVLHSVWNLLQNNGEGEAATKGLYELMTVTGR